MKGYSHIQSRGIAGPVLLAAALVTAGVITGDARGQDAALGQAPGLEYSSVPNEPGHDYAYAAGVTMDYTFTRLDVNGNGILSKDEARRLEPLAEGFDAVDANNDLQISPREFADYERERMQHQQSSG